jgi:hypothetical protein
MITLDEYMKERFGLDSNFKYCEGDALLYYRQLFACLFLAEQDFKHQMDRRDRYALAEELMAMVLGYA